MRAIQENEGERDPMGFGERVRGRENESRATQENEGERDPMGFGERVRGTGKRD